MAYSERSSHRKKRNFFEGWYFKQENNQDIISVIPGISLDKQGNKKIFIQVIGRGFSDCEYFDNYMASRKKLDVKIGNNEFSEEGIKLDFHGKTISISGELRFTNMQKLKNSLYSPGIMGPFSYLSFMECYHGIISINHQVDGELNINGKISKFENDRGYIERDFGRSFPKSYIWVQSNKFHKEKTSLFFSYARIPFLGLRFKGLISVLHYQGKQYRFATYNFSHIKSLLDENNQIKIEIKKRKYRLLLIAEADNKNELLAPKNGQMISTVKESISGRVEVFLYKGKQLLFHDIGTNSGVEYDKIEQLYRRNKKRKAD